MSDIETSHLDHMRSALLRYADREPDWVTELRRQAIAAFEEKGLPTSRDEDWKHHRVSRHLDRELAESPAAGVATAFAAPSIENTAVRLTFVDGGAVTSPGTELPAGVRVESLRDALRDTRDGVPAWLGRCAEFRTRGLAALNTAFLGDGALVVIDPGIDLAEPIHIVHVATEASADRLVSLRNLVVAGAGSRCHVVEHHWGPGASSVTNVVTEVAVEEGAEVRFTKFLEGNAETAHLASMDAVVMRDGRFHAAAVSNGGAAGRTETRVRLAETGAECDLSLLPLGRGTGIQDMLTRVEHAAPHTRSSQLHRAVVDDSARSVFNGLVVVNAGAHGTVGEQSSRSLVLSRTADAHSRPQLDISEDDVKCAHGATIGALDPAALFYLRSRGIGADDAQRLLVRSFAGQAIAGIEAGPVRREAERLLTEWLKR